MRKTPEQKIAEAEAEMAALRRKVRMERVPGVKEAVVLAKALRNYAAAYAPADTDLHNLCIDTANILDTQANEPEPNL